MTFTQRNGRWELKTSQVYLKLRNIAFNGDGTQISAMKTMENPHGHKTSKSQGDK